MVCKHRFYILFFKIISSTANQRMLDVFLIDFLDSKKLIVGLAKVQSRVLCGWSLRSRSPALARMTSTVLFMRIPRGVMAIVVMAIRIFFRAEILSKSELQVKKGTR